MQTFLPYKSFEKSAKCLDYRRLGKQRVEAWQIYQTLQKIKERNRQCKSKSFKEWCINRENHMIVLHGWYNVAWEYHPIVKMWYNYEDVLLRYGLVMCNEWIRRGYKDTMKERFLSEICRLGYLLKKDDYPNWLRNRKFHASHRSNLLRKDKKYYKKFNWKEKSNLPYVWIIKGEKS
jgi:hypothetical protein